MTKPDRIKFEVFLNTKDVNSINMSTDKLVVYADQVAIGPTGQLIFTTHVEVGLNTVGEMEYEPTPTLILQSGEYLACMAIKDNYPLYTQSGKISTITTNTKQ